MAQLLTIAKNPQPIDLDRVRLADAPLKSAKRNLILGVVTLLGVSAGFWVAVTLTISHWLR